MHMCSSGVVVFTRVRPRGCCVNPGSLGSLARAMESLGSLACALGFVGFILSRWVRSCEPWRSLGSSEVVRFTRARPVVLRVNPGSLGSLACALGVVGFTQSRPRVASFIRGRWFHSHAP